MFARVSLTNMPDSTTPSVTAGSTRCHITSPKAGEVSDAQRVDDVEARPARTRKPPGAGLSAPQSGNHPRSTPKTSCSSRPSQNTGMQ